MPANVSGYARVNGGLEGGVELRNASMRSKTTNDTG